MKIEEFTEIIKGLKNSRRRAKEFNRIRFMVIDSRGGPVFWYYFPRRKTKRWTVYIEFKHKHQQRANPQRPTLFQTGLINAVFCDKVLPLDCAAYHHSKEGIEFIKNIKRYYVEVV